MPFPPRPFHGSGLTTPIPRQGRRVHTPGIGIGIRAVSDLIPTDSVTETYPEIGVTTYGTIKPSDTNIANQAFASYIACELRDEGLREGGWFTRVIYGPPNLGPVFPATGAVVYSTKWKSERVTWHPILKEIHFLPDRSSIVFVTDINGITTKVPRLRVQYSYHPGITVPTSIKEEYFLSLTPFDLDGFNIADFAPKPTEISWEIDPLGRDGTIGECLHKKQVTPIITQNGGISNLGQREFPATNETSWVDYPIDFEVSYEEPFYVGILSTAIAPTVSKLVKIII